MGRQTWIAISVFFHIANIGTAYRIVSMGSSNNQVIQDTNTDDCEEGTLGTLWDLLAGGAGETERSADDSINDEPPESNIDGHKGRMVRMMKRSVQANKKRKCRGKSPKKRQNRLGQDCITRLVVKKS